MTTTFVRLSDRRYYIFTGERTSFGAPRARTLTENERRFREKHVRLAVGEEVTVEVPR